MVEVEVEEEEGEEEEMQTLRHWTHHSDVDNNQASQSRVREITRRRKVRNRTSRVCHVSSLST